jgi:hypothetical protein
MDLYKIISELRELQKKVEAAIATLETLENREKVLPPRRKRGRPPKNAEKGPTTTT